MEMKEIIQEAKTKEEAIAMALEKLGADESQVDIEVLEETGKLFGLIGSKSARVKVVLKANPVVEVEDFVKRVMNFLGVEADLRVEEEDDAIYATVTGDDTGMLIGRFGQTLDSIQYLSNVILSRRYPEHPKVILNISDYRQRREISLKKMAKSLAAKVQKTRRSVILAPMPPHDRRLIHITLADFKNVATFSDGTGKNRKVTIAYKDDK